MNQDYNILIVADTNCLQDMADIELSRERLYSYLRSKNLNYNVCFYTCTGKYGFDNNLKALEINDRNKTSFAKSIEYYLNKIDDVVILTNYENEPYLSALRQTLHYNRVSSMTFPYEIK